MYYLKTAGLLWQGVVLVPGQQHRPVHELGNAASACIALTHTWFILLIIPTYGNPKHGGVANAWRGRRGIWSFGRFLILVRTWQRLTAPENNDSSATTSKKRKKNKQLIVRRTGKRIGTTTWQRLASNAWAPNARIHGELATLGSYQQTVGFHAMRVRDRYGTTQPKRAGSFSVSHRRAAAPAAPSPAAGTWARCSAWRAPPSRAATEREG